jgi:hypothetical protein
MGVGAMEMLLMISASKPFDIYPHVGVGRQAGTTRKLACVERILKLIQRIEQLS